MSFASRLPTASLVRASQAPPARRRGQPLHRSRSTRSRSTYLNSVDVQTSGATSKGGLNGVYTGALFFGAGSIGAEAGLAPGTTGAVAIHAVAGCLSSEVSGGECKNGALSAAFSEAASPYIKGGKFEKVVLHAVVGGTASAIGGGKFTNGAFTGAFGYIFNEVGHTDGAPYGPANGEGDHSYIGWTKLVTGCDEVCSSAWSKAASSFSFPSENLEPTSFDATGRPQVVYGALQPSNPSSYSIPGGRITQSLQPDGSITNITLNDHTFCCGTVTRSIVRVNDSLYMLTMGSGRNYLPFTQIPSSTLARFNSYIGSQVFKALDQQLIDSMKSGSR